MEPWGRSDCGAGWVNIELKYRMPCHLRIKNVKNSIRYTASPDSGVPSKRSKQFLAWTSFGSRWSINPARSIYKHTMILLHSTIFFLLHSSYLSLARVPTPSTPEYHRMSEIHVYYSTKSFDLLYQSCHWVIIIPSSDGYTFLSRGGTFQ